MKSPVFGERRIVRSPMGPLQQVEFRLQEWRPRFFGLCGAWVTLCSAHGYMDMGWTMKEARKAVEERAKDVFTGSDFVVWSSHD